jgi:hydroxymethylbilane synthase
LRNRGIETEIEIISTQGDRVQHLSLDKLEGKGFFTKEIEDALLANEIDIAVHSYKDLATTQPPGLLLAAITEREQANDLLLSTQSLASGHGLMHLKTGARVGTSSLRRKAMLRYHRPDLELVDLRGNVPTRIEKLRAGLDAIVIALAGVKRINADLSGLSAVAMLFDDFVPAPAQGALAIQMRESDAMFATVAQLNHLPTQISTDAERKVLQLLGGGCHLPLGVYVDGAEGEYMARVFYAPPQGAATFFTCSATHTSALPDLIMQHIHA